MTGDSFIVKGLGGKRTISGEIAVNGAKNAVLPAMASALLFRGAVRYENVPSIEDVRRIAELITKLGAIIEKPDAGSLTINTAPLSSGHLDPEISKRLRASIV